VETILIYKCFKERVDTWLARNNVNKLRNDREFELAILTRAIDDAGVD